MRYYFESALSPNVIWVSLADIDFSPHSGIRSLKIEGEDLMGNVTKPLKPTETINFLAPD